MGMYLNPGSERFQTAVNSEIYVDKTMLIKYTNKYLCTKDKYMAVSRPRRFGKTTAMDMLCAYYSRGCESKALFTPYKIVGDDSFEAHLNCYNVIRLDMSKMLGKAGTVAGMTDYVNRILLKEVKRAYTDLDIAYDKKSKRHRCMIEETMK